jgi:hypothetical protein
MNVHHEITKKMNRHVNIIETYKTLDQKRESEIERVLAKGKNKEEFSVVAINEVTMELNQFANTHHLPLRKLVTNDMVLEFINQK